MKKLFIIIVVFFLSVPVFSKEVPSSGAMFFDITLARPLGIVSVGAGAILFIVGAPFWLFTPNPAETIRQTGTRLVVYPVRFTFQRSIGDFPGYLEELEFVAE